MTAAPALAATYTNDTIRQKQAEIEETKKEQEEIQESISDVEAVKEQLESSKSDLESYVTQLDAELTQMQENIDSLNQQIDDKEAEIEQTKQELEEAQKEQEEQYEAMKVRIRLLYEKGDDYFLAIFLDAGSYADMLNKVNYIEKLSQYDQKKLEEYKEQVQLVETTKEQLEAEQDTLEEAKAGVETEQANMEELVSEKENEIAAVSASISEQEASLEEYQAQIAQQDSEIAALESEVEAEEQRLEEEAKKAEEEAKRKAAEEALANRKTYTGGTFTWPCPDYTEISSDYGYRVHPIYQTELFHNGIDMAAPSGSPILAAADGTVVAASYSSSMGNYVMIDHGSGLYTIYMHASALYVSAGDSVAAGQQIAAVGSTGNSTGPHLHFSVRLNGQYVNPWQYLGS
jgi:murein DD-endopeptidase MepM/ murein hydrolase activator NlpD